MGHYHSVPFKIPKNVKDKNLNFIATYLLKLNIKVEDYLIFKEIFIYLLYFMNVEY
jgi:hypothetical protein